MDALKTIGYMLGFILLIMGPFAIFFWGMAYRKDRKRPASMPTPSEPVQLPVHPVVDVPTVAPVAITPITPKRRKMPDSLPLAQFLPNIPKDTIVYGVVLPEHGGVAWLYQTLENFIHQIMLGDTGSGKTSALNSLIVQLHHIVASGTPMHLFAVDRKQQLDATWSRSALMKDRVGTTVDHAIVILRYMLVELDRRMQLFKQTGKDLDRVITDRKSYTAVTGESLPILLFVFDEMNAILETCADKALIAEMMSALASIMQMGRGAGVFVWGGAQYVTADVYGRALTKQFVNRFVLGAWDSTANNLTFTGAKVRDEDRELITGKAGRGLVRTAQYPTPIPFHSLYAEEPDILEAVRLVADLPLDLPSLTLKPTAPAVAVETPKPVPSFDPELVARVMVAMDENPNATAYAISKLLGHKGGRPFEAIKAIYDSVKHNREDIQEIPSAPSNTFRPSTPSQEGGRGENNDSPSPWKAEGSLLAA